MRMQKPVILKNNRSSKSKITEFDYDNAKIVLDKESNGKVLVARQKNYDSKTNNLSLGLYLDNNDNVLSYFIVKNDKINNEYDKISYLDYDNNVLTEVYLNKKTNTFESPQQKISSRRGCGQAVANCVSNAYSEQGWKSVGLFIVTAFQPEISLVVAGLCAGKNC